MLTSAALRDFREFVKRRIYSAQYRVGSTYYAAKISEIEITNENIVRVKIPIAHNAAGTINQVRLISVENEVWCSKDVEIVLESAQTQFLQWFDFVIMESEVR